MIPDIYFRKTWAKYGETPNFTSVLHLTCLVTLVNSQLGVWEKFNLVSKHLIFKYARDKVSHFLKIGTFAHLVLNSKGKAGFTLIPVIIIHASLITYPFIHDFIFTFFNWSVPCISFVLDKKPTLSLKRQIQVSYYLISEWQINKHLLAL